DKLVIFGASYSINSVNHGQYNLARVYVKANSAGETASIRTPYNLSLRGGETYTLSWISSKRAYVNLSNVWVLVNGQINFSVFSNLKETKIDEVDVSGTRDVY